MPFFSCRELHSLHSDSRLSTPGYSQLDITVGDSDVSIPTSMGRLDMKRRSDIDYLREERERRNETAKLAQIEKRLRDMRTATESGEVEQIKHAMHASLINTH